ncbi:MAG: UDP-glucose 4-epimerase GalE [Oscillospiraceae bacterium]|nr:UDP-glucose 4-epimerase GalE [Oscillospiraceae bacterium]
MAKCVLVSGGAGFIGSHVTVELIEAGYDVVVADNMSNCDMTCFEGVRKIIGRDLPFEKIDFCDAAATDRLFSDYKIDAVIHFAAFKAVGESVEKPVMYYKNNLGSFLNVLEAASAHGCHNVLFSSSATVYGEPDKVPVTEETPRKPATSPYGATKQMCEDILNDTVKATAGTPGEIRGILLRYFNPIGAHASGLIGEDPRGVPNNLMPYIAQVAVGRRDHLSVYGDDYDTPDGTGVRDYIHVVDLARGHVCAIEYMLGHRGENVFNLGTGTGYSVLDMVHAFERVTGVKIPYEIVGRRPGDLATVYSSSDKSAQLLGWKAQYTLDDMCRDTWAWQSKNPMGYEG